MGNTQGVEPTNAVETMKRAAPNVASDAPEATLSKDGLKGHILQWQVSRLASCQRGTAV